MAKKAKTRKAITKRIRITKTGKMIRRSGHQNHFNAKQSGSFTQRHGETKEIHSTDQKKIIGFLNY